MIPKQKTFDLYIRILKGLIGQVVPSLHLAKLVLTVNAAVLPSSRNSPLVLYLSDSTLCEQEWTEGDALAGFVLLPAI